jgi:ubiquinone biosynthesis protein COQ9
MKKLLLSSLIILSIVFYAKAQSNNPIRIPQHIQTVADSKPPTDLYLAWEVFKIVFPMVI